ncbi:hypothetical protein ABKN59_010909 [Abortiporus biennis]
MSDTPTSPQKQTSSAALRRVKLRRFRARQDFCVDSYSVDHPPPVKSFEGGIPYCALGYVVDGRWLDRYAHEHGLVKEDGTTLHRDSTMNEAIFYLLDKTKQRDIMCKRIGDGMGYLGLMSHLPGYAQRSNVIVNPQLAKRTLFSLAFIGIML